MIEEEVEIGRGRIIQGNSLLVMPTLPTVSTIFADPPFNLNKQYGDHFVDARNDYEEWTRLWIGIAAERLAEGGSFWYFNIPQWAAVFFDEARRHGLSYVQQVAISLSTGVVKSHRLTPTHYSLIHFSRGRLEVAGDPIRLPIQTCRHCGGDIKDYGGKRASLHPDGLRLTDVWTDLSPIRHRHLKWREANQLPEEIVRRALWAAPPLGIVLDPFLGSGTTAAVAEKMGYPWVGIELGKLDAAKERMTAVVDGWTSEHPPR